MTNAQNPNAWEKSTPQTFAELAFADDYVRQDLYDYVRYPRLCGNIVLQGGYGSGKSTIAALIAKERLGSTASIYEVNGEAWDDDALLTLRGIFNLARLCDEVPVVIINEVDRLKDRQYKLRDFLDEYTQQMLVIMTTNHLSKIDGSILDRSDVYTVRGFEPQQAVDIAQRVLQLNGVSVSNSDLQQLFERGLFGDETELSLRQIGRTVDKLVIQSLTVQKPLSKKPKLTVV